jgi:hypothetical protein
MRRIYSTLTLLFLSVLFFQCQREVSHIGEPDFPGQIATPDPITAAIQGNVFDENGTPEPGVTVQVGSKTAITNTNGYFRINAASLDKKSAVITASKTGYFKAYRTFGATSGANFVQIKLIKRALTGTIDGAAGGEVSLTNGSKVLLPANGVVNAATNAAYTGQVNVYAAYIDPTVADFNEIVPGSLLANDKDGKRVLLTSYGMLSVELESTSGEKLQVKNGSTAKITTAIPATGQASAPTSIPLWYVDETTGIWKEEGTATRNGNVYVGDVKHFTYWNCDIPVQTVSFTATLVLPSGKPLTNAYVSIRPTSGNYSGAAHGYSDSLGQINGAVPANMNLVMEIRQYGMGGCNSLIYSQNIGPFSQAANLGVITVTPQTNSVLTVKGKLVDCNGAPVTNGYAEIHYFYYTIYASVNATGDFEANFTQCGSIASSPIQIVGVNSATQQQNVIPASAPAVLPVTNAGTITACGTSSAEYINYTLDGTNFSITSPADSVRGSTLGQPASQRYTTISGESMSNANRRLSFVFMNPSYVAGTYPLSSIRVNNLDSTSMVTPINVNITNFPQNPNGFYEGSFSGQFRDQTNATHTVNANFRVKMQ